jgi:hypothetical protein
MTLVVGDHDEHIGSADLAAQSERLEHHGIVPRIVRYGGGHHLDGGVLLGLADSVSAGS